MGYTVTATNQGQISIPAGLRRKFGINGGTNLLLHETDDGQIMMKPLKDLLDYGGFFKTKKRVTIKQEKEAFANYLATRHLKRGNFPFPHVNPK